MSTDLPLPSAESLAAMRTTRPWTMEDAAVTADRLRAQALNAAVQNERQRSGRLVGRIKAACLALDDLREDPGYGVGVADAELAVLAIVNEYLAVEGTP